MYSLKTSERVLYGDTYLVISLEGKSLIPYQEDMLYENRLPGYLGFYTKFESETLVLYNITNCVCLSDFIGNRQLTRMQYLMIADAVVDAMILRDQYFLSENSLLIDQGYIYIKDNSEVAMVYLPAEVDIDTKLALRGFIAWLTTKLDISEPGAGEASIPLQLILNNPSFNLKVVKETITRILASGPQEAFQKTRGQARAPRKSNQLEIPDAPPGNKAKARQKAGVKASGGTKKQEANLFGIGEKKKKTSAKPQSKSPKKRAPIRDGYAVQTQSEPIVGDGYHTDKPPLEADRGYHTDKQPNYANPDMRVYNISTDILREYGGGISEDIQVIVYLLFMPNTSGEQIIQIDKSPYSIGRGEKSDYLINDISISREHAKIVLERNKVYLIDTKSKFGTYVNDVKIQPDSPVELKDDDNIMFSGLAYTVKIVRMDDLYSVPR